MNKKFLPTPVALTVEKKEVFFVLPYLGNLSLVIRTRLQKSINKNFPFCKIKVVFKSTTSLSNFFHFKDKVLFIIYALMWFINSRVLYAMLLITAKNADI